MGQMISALLTGALFAVGLLVSGMTDPANVKGFLDVFGDWRPQLMAVLGAGVVVTYIVYRMARTREHPLIAPKILLARVEPGRQTAPHRGCAVRCGLDARWILPRPGSGGCGQFATRRDYPYCCDAGR